MICFGIVYHFCMIYFLILSFFQYILQLRFSRLGKTVFCTNCGLEEEKNVFFLCMMYSTVELRVNSSVMRLQ